MPLVSKYLWRKGWMRIPTSCTVGEDCVTTCPTNLYEDRGMTPYDVLMDVHALAWLASATGGMLVSTNLPSRCDISGSSSSRLQKQ